MTQSKNKNFVMKITKILLLLPLLLLSNSSNAKPFELNTYEENYQKTKTEFTFSKLNQLAVKCLYDKAWLDMDVDLKSGVSSRKRGYTESQDTFVGLVATVPLFSGKEMDRERDRTLDRKRQVATDISIMIENVEKVLHNRRMIEIYKIMENRSRKRVQSGSTPLTEQIEVMEKLSNLRKETITFAALVGGKYTALLNSCKPGTDRNILKEYMDNELTKLELEF